MPSWPGLPLGKRCTNPTLYLPGLKRASASLLLSPFPDAQHPPPRLCYGERRGPISAPLDLRLPLLTSSDRQRRRLEGRGLDWAKAGNWGTRDTHSLRR